MVAASKASWSRPRPSTAWTVRWGLVIATARAMGAEADRVVDDGRGSDDVEVGRGARGRVEVQHAQASPSQRGRREW